MNMKRYMIMAALAVLASCSPKAMEKTTENGSELGFSVDFIRHALQVSDPDENLSVSPYSAGVAMSMLTEGADGETKAELDDALNGCLFTTADLGSNDTVRITSANSVWLDNDFAVRNEYVSHMQKEYDALATVLSFSDPATVKAINEWCAEHTDGMIKGIVSRLDPDMKMILANALYFNAEWAKTFNAGLTKPGVFHGAKGDTDISFMYKKDYYGYAEYYGNQLIELPYRTGRYAMYILLPAADMNVHDVVSYLYESGVKEVMGLLERRQVNLKMPKFKVETDVSLVKTFEAMGVRTAFTPAADLSGIARGPLAVSDVLQKTVVEVNEKGTVAAAVTSVMVGLTSAQPEKPANMYIDRPFVYMIADMEQERILFAGKIMNL
jgi:serpin B